MAGFPGFSFVGALARVPKYLPDKGFTGQGPKEVEGGIFTVDQNPLGKRLRPFTFLVYLGACPKLDGSTANAAVSARSSDPFR
jgi:hypothetical protein